MEESDALREGQAESNLGLNPEKLTCWASIRGGGGERDPKL